MPKTLRADITYKRLGQTLTKLGFERQEGDTFTAFSDESHDALIVLPQTAPDEEVSDRHLIAVERTLEGKGVASRTQFYEVLARPDTRRTKFTLKGRSTKPAGDLKSGLAVRGRDGRKRTKASH
jgi:hypothetical protein